jgi:Phosphotransferase enzyme family
MSQSPTVGLFPDIQSLLEETFRMTGWTIARAAEGQQKDCYIATTAQRTAFLKLDGNTPVDVLRRLGELGVAPHLVRAGEIVGRPYVLQDYVSGMHPGWRWFADYLPPLARVARRYHSDSHLQHLLAASTPPMYHERLSEELAVLELQLSSALADMSRKMMAPSTLGRVFADLKSQADQLHAVTLVPVHPDPNGANIFLTDETIVLVDWDDMLLSDPLRDVSQWLGWYVPHEHWPMFFGAYGLPVDEALLARVYWWSARAAFANVLWHLERGYEYGVFLQDTLAALQRDITPHQVFLEDV